MVIAGAGSVRIEPDADDVDPAIPAIPREFVVPPEAGIPEDDLDRVLVPSD